MLFYELLLLYLLYLLRFGYMHANEKLALELEAGTLSWYHIHFFNLFYLYSSFNNVHYLKAALHIYFFLV